MSAVHKKEIMLDAPVANQNAFNAVLKRQIDRWENEGGKSPTGLSVSEKYSDGTTIS